MENDIYGNIRNIASFAKDEWDARSRDRAAARGAAVGHRLAGGWLSPISGTIGAKVGEMSHDVRHYLKNRGRQFQRFRRVDSEFGESTDHAFGRLMEMGYPPNFPTPGGPGGLPPHIQMQLMAQQAHQQQQHQQRSPGFIDRVARSIDHGVRRGLRHLTSPAHFMVGNITNTINRIIYGQAPQTVGEYARSSTIGGGEGDQLGGLKHHARNALHTGLWSMADKFVDG